MEKQIKRVWILVGVMVLGIIILFFVGKGASKQCVEIGECKACWSTIPVPVTSELCGASGNGTKTCTPEPYKVQHNAVIDAILCACKNSKSPDVQKSIKEVFANLNCPPGVDECQYDLTAAEICTGKFLIKWQY